MFVRRVNSVGDCRQYRLEKKKTRRKGGLW